MTVVGAGARHGLYTLLASKRAGRSGRLNIGDGEWGEWPALAAIAAFGKRRTRAKASVCVVAPSTGLKGPLPRTEVRGFHRAGLLRTKCCRACLSKWIEFPLRRSGHSYFIHD